MRALTFWPEWVPVILDLEPENRKDVENRPWPLPEAFVDRWIALHAGRYIGGRPGAREDALSSVCCTAEFARVPRSAILRYITDAPKIPLGAVVALIRFGRPTRTSSSRWAFRGSWHWPITGRQKLTVPVPCRGFQGLWTVPADVEHQVREQLGNASKFFAKPETSLFEE